MRDGSTLYPLPDKLYLPLATLFFFLLGSQLLVNFWLVFILFSLFLIDWKRLFSIEVGVLALFLFSLYGGLAYRDQAIAVHLQEAVMVFVVYLLGLSLRGVSTNETLDEKKLFYLLYAFFFAYILAILYSYLALPQDMPLKTWGMQVYYRRGHEGILINDGKLLSSIIAYFLTMAAAMLPLLIFNFKAFIERKFTLFELFFIGAAGIFSLYLATEMGRRTTIFILLLISLFMVAKIVYVILKRHNIYWALSFFAGTILVFIVGYYLVADTLAVKRILVRGLGDPRYGWWMDGLRYAIKYPWGGGENIVIQGQYIYAYNLWVDIGKSYGIFALLSLVAFHLLHIKYFYRIFHHKEISSFMKNLIFIIALVIVTYFIIEPVYQSEKSYFFYTIFLLGFIKAYSELYTTTVPIVDERKNS